MKTVRFAKVVDKSGRPEVHLALIAPSKDRPLQSAEKAYRVMTVMQENVGTTADHGEIGLHPGKGRQYLIFPKSLRSFAGAKVVGIKYDLIAAPEIPKSQRAKPAKAPRKAPTKAKSQSALEMEKEGSDLSSKLVAFKPEAADENEDASEDVAELKKQVRRAMAALEEGKQVAAFNLLKRALEA